MEYSPIPNMDMGDCSTTNNSGMKIASCLHPAYLHMYDEWVRFRDIAESGTEFVKKYTKMFSNREKPDEFIMRKDLTACPAFAKAAVNEIKNTLYRSMCDIVRLGGSKIYQDAVSRGVTKHGQSMDVFIGQAVVFELLTMGKVGVYIDRDPIYDGETRATSDSKIPYLYTYKAEDIYSWVTNESGELTAVVLRDHKYEMNEFGLPKYSVFNYRHLYLTNDMYGNTVVHVDFYDKDSQLIDSKVLQMDRIPFVIFELSQSLLTDVVGHQIALLNLGSSDMNLTKFNFPFLTEQVNPLHNFYADNPADPAEVTSADDLPWGSTTTPTPANQQASKALGPTYGLQYVRGLERPGFINPSSEPLSASMNKQAALRDEIKQLVNLSVTNIEPRRESAESKKMDKSGKEEGLSYIAQELEHGEQEIAKVWAKYEGSDTVASVRYPTDYSVRTDFDRRAEANELCELLPKIPSLTYQKVLARRVAALTMENHAKPGEIDKAFSEINKARIIVIDPTVIQMDHEAGFVSDKTASESRGYPEGEVEQAKKDHAERAARVALAQSKANQGAIANGADRQNKDLSDPLQRKMDKRSQLANGKQSDVGSNKDIDADPEE